MILEFLQVLFPDWIITNLFGYITFRVVCVAILSFLAVVTLMPKLIHWLKHRNYGESIRDDGPESHQSKDGTPTMGGLLIVLVVGLLSILFCRLEVTPVWIALFSLLSAGSIGFADDYLKWKHGNSKGLSFRVKMLALGVIGLLAVYWSLASGVIDPQVRFPFFKDLYFGVGWFFYVWGFLVIVGSSNAVNLTDGLDGLAIVPVMTTAFVLLVISYVLGHALFSNYLQFPTITGSGELAVILGAVIGSGLGFLWYNCHPAQIFMGDVGSLSLGSLLGTVALLTHQEVVLFIAGFLFVMEAISVMLQVGYYKSSKKRIFRMAPLHHHFELGGWPESKVIVRFWILSIIFALLALSTLKVR